jgi:D-alanyl-lipoteichoic acid acyltransferase DltB (MBOAT superfamily)
MLFNSLQYLIFLPIVVLLYWVVPQKWRPLLLLCASYIFYAAWKPIYLVLIIVMTLANYVFGFLISSTKTLSKFFLVMAISVNLLILCYYKYANFIVQSLFRALNLVHIPHGDLKFDVILPLGISFFTFEFLHYIIEVYKGGQVIKDPIKFAVFAGFFPTQIAGPIKRYLDFIPQITEGKNFDISQFEKGFVMVLHGLAKKVLLADNLATYVNLVYGAPASATNADLWLATYAFAFQVYCDFSGYTDIAIGSSLMMGIEIPPNFNVPFMASSIRDLWHRQHISLSHWFRDYVYFSLGGSRCSQLRSYFNLIMTTSLAGLWHGAAWHYVMWGVFQGVSLIVHREWMRLYQDRPWLNKFVKTRLWYVMAIFITFQAFCISYVFFRAGTNSIALNMLGRMLRPWESAPQIHPLFLSTKGPLVAPLVPFIVAALAIAHILSEFLRRNSFWSKTPRLLQAMYCVFLIVMMLALMPDQSSRFIYFQF